jgi:PAS domain S-box-containing protein
MPAAVVSRDGRVLHANSCLRLIVSDGVPGGVCGEKTPGGGDGLLDRFQGLRRVLDTAARMGNASGEVGFGAADGGPCPAVQVHARSLPTASDGCPLILVTFGYGDAAEMLRRRLGDYESRYRELLQTSTDMVFLMDLGGNFASVNKSWQQRTGYAADEIVGTNGLDRVYPEFHPAYLAALERVKSGQYVENLEFRADKKDGSYLDVLANLAPVRSDQGQVVQVIGAGRDITEFKHAREELKNSEERLKILFEDAPDAYFLTDLRGAFLDGNRAAEEICGYRIQELIGKSFLNDLLPKNQLPRAAGLLAKNALGRPTGPTEFRLNRKDGTQVDIEIRSYPVRIAGQTVVLDIARDISERKKTEEMLEALNHNLKATISDLERSNQELRDFAHVAAHDLKAPLRGIATLAEWISQDYADKIDAQGQENLKLLRQRVERMTLLINGILRYAEIGHGDHSVESVDTAVVVAEAVEQIAPPAHITIRVDSPLPVVSCEKVALTQVFMNLISNAVKYMDKPRGEIRIAAAQDGDFWRFSVTDNGMGIEERHFDRLFQMFQTLVPSNNGQSTGIGLAVVKKIVQMQGGGVGVESKPGRGSTFFFTLPQREGRDDV